MLLFFAKSGFTTKTHPDKFSYTLHPTCRYFKKINSKLYYFYFQSRKITLHTLTRFVIIKEAKYAVCGLDFILPAQV